MVNLLLPCLQRIADNETIIARAFAAIVRNVPAGISPAFDFSTVLGVSAQDLLRPLRYFKTLQNLKTSRRKAANVYRKYSHCEIGDGEFLPVLLLLQTL